MSERTGHVVAGVCVLLFAAGTAVLGFATDAWLGGDRTTFRWVLLVGWLATAALLAIGGATLVAGVWRRDDRTSRDG